MADQIMVSDSMLASLNATRPWVKFLAILGFIVCGLMVLGALAMFAGGAMLPGGGGAMGFAGPIVGCVYLVFAVAYFFCCRYMWRYASAIAQIPATGQAALEQALSSQKSVWKFMGVLAAIIVAIEVIVVIAAVAFGVMASKGG